MQDVNEQMEMEQYTRHSARDDKHAAAGPGPGETGFVVKGAPWEQTQSTPNTSSIEDFPTFGDNSSSAPTSSGPWGPRR